MILPYVGSSAWSSGPLMSRRIYNCLACDKQAWSLEFPLFFYKEERQKNKPEDIHIRPKFLSGDEVSICEERVSQLRGSFGACGQILNVSVLGIQADEIKCFNRGREGISRLEVFELKVCILHQTESPKLGRVPMQALSQQDSMIGYDQVCYKCICEVAHRSRCGCLYHRKGECTVEPLVGGAHWEPPCFPTY